MVFQAALPICLKDHNEEKNKIINIIQQGSPYHHDQIEEEKQKSYLDAMILRRNHKESHSELNSDVLDKAISKETDHGWALTLTI